MFKNINSGSNKLKIIAVGDTVTKNLTIYDDGVDIIAVDYGIGFPESDDFGIDYIVPDLTYLLDNQERFKALFITHAHNDHYGAVPYLLKQIKVPIYCNRLTMGLIQNDLTEKQNKGLSQNLDLRLFNASTEPIKIGNFEVSAFNVNHSVPGSLGISINTPQGRILHIADFKVDWSPVIDKPMDVAALASYGKEGVLCLLSDSLGSDHEGYVPSERTLDHTFPEIFEENPDRQIFITIISSNVSRMHQIIDAANKFDRKVAFIGRSMDQVSQVARNTGYLNFPADIFLSSQQAATFDQTKVVYIIGGCYGQSNSSLARLARHEHTILSMQEGALVVFSSSPDLPGTDMDIEAVLSDLVHNGAEILTSRTNNHLHVSGHGYKGDKSIVVSLVRPKYFIPIGGTFLHMRAYTDMVEELGFDRKSVFELGEGAVLEFENGEAKLGTPIEVKDIYIDGGALDPIVVKDREQLSSDGVFVVIVPKDKNEVMLLESIDIVTRGFIYVKESKDLMNRTKDFVSKHLRKAKTTKDDWSQIRHGVEREVGRFLQKETGRNPIVIVHSLLI